MTWGVPHGAPFFCALCPLPAGCGPVPAGSPEQVPAAAPRTSRGRRNARPQNLAPGGEKPFIPPTVLFPAGASSTRQRPSAWPDLPRPALPPALPSAPFAGASSTAEYAIPAPLTARAGAFCPLPQYTEELQKVFTAYQLHICKNQLYISKINSRYKVKCKLHINC